MSVTKFVLERNRCSSYQLARETNGESLTVKHKELYELGSRVGVVLLIMTYTERPRPKKDTFIRLQVYKRIGISQIEV